MKNLILPLAIFSLIMITNSCKKESMIKENQVSLNARDTQLANAINSFKTKGKSNLKNTEKVSIDSAIWYLEATANFTYSDGIGDRIELTRDSAIFTLAINTEGKISLNEVWSQYELLIDNIRARYQSLNQTNKQLIGVDVKANQILSNSIEVQANYTIASGSAVIPNACTFNNVDCWKWWNGGYGSIPGTNGGICCGPNANTHLESDAAEEIQKRIHQCQAIPSGNYWYDEVETKRVYAWDFPNPSWNVQTDYENYYQYRMFWNSSNYAYFHDCLNPEELNFYLNGTKWIINTLEDPNEGGGARPEGKSFISVNVQGNALWIGSSSDLFHEAWITYGVLHVRPGSPDPLN